MPTLTTIATAEREAVALAEPVVSEPQPDRARHDREAEDRVREVVQRPGDRHDRAAGRGQRRQAAVGPLRRWTADGAALATRRMIAASRGYDAGMTIGR